jgi:predicted signal transduction protein with EAL and GGDEF domain
MGIDTRRWLKDRRITVSVGLTLAQPTGDTASAMLQRADAALYEAKRSGRNCVKSQCVEPEAEGVQVGVVTRPASVEYA